MKKLVFSLLFFAFSFSLIAQTNANTPRLSMAIVEGSLQLQWELSREINTSYFVVEKLVAGSNDYEPIHSEKANGYSHFKTSYDFEEYLISAQNKYRVVLVMMDGTRVYSNVIVVPQTDLKPLDTASSIVTK